MKMTREQLKSLVKECLVELLRDGIGNVVAEASARKQPALQEQKKAFDPRFDTPIRKQQQPVVNKAAIKSLANGDSVMESIFADTIKTTLAEQIAHGDVSPQASGATQQTAQEQFRGNPIDIFGEEAASKWASLAFMDGTKKL
jgi:hypothetical protein